MGQFKKMAMGLAAIAVVSTVAISAPAWAQSLPDAGDLIGEYAPASK